MITLGKDSNKAERQKRVRARLIDPLDSSSSYRAIEVLDELQTPPEEDLETLAQISDLSLEGHSQKQTMGVRQILDVEDEKQPNGKISKKVFLTSFFI